MECSAAGSTVGGFLLWTGAAAGWVEWRAMAEWLLLETGTKTKYAAAILTSVSLETALHAVTILTPLCQLMLTHTVCHCC
jgi:hypothetical protein